jgi:hypothetical protein
MHIALTDYNVATDTTYRIYRSYAPLDPENLPPVLVELPYGTAAWQDPNVEFQRIVYYRVGIVHEGNEIIGPQYCSQQRYYTGPQINKDRPDVVIRGNGEVGRYGDMLVDQVVPQQIVTDFLGSAASPINPEPVGQFYEKCELFEKIIFFPSQPNYVTSYKDMYLAGCAFGTDNQVTLTDEMKAEIGTEVPQGRILLSGGHAFRVRLMTRAEFLTCYSLLFPESVHGTQSDIVLSRCNYYDSPIVTTGEEQGLNSFHSALYGSPAYTNWASQVPTPVVLELINRNEVGQAEPESENYGTPEDVKVTFYSNATIMNGRFHVIGGAYYLPSNSTYPAVVDHWSVNLEGGDLQWHAPIPVATSYAATWTDGETIYVFGGATNWSGNYTPSEFTDAYQMWSDPNNDGIGVWTQATANQPGKFGAQAIVVTDSVTGVQRLEIIGSDLSARKRPFRYWGNIKNPTGTFEASTSTAGGLPGAIGSVVGQHRGRIMAIGGGGTVNAATNRYGWTRGDTIPLSSFYYNETGRRGGYSQTTSDGLLVSWRDGLFLVPTARNGLESGIWQYIADEFRWVFLKIPSAISGKDFFPRGTAFAYQDNVIMAYTGAYGPWDKAEVKRLKLRDTIDEPLIPISTVDIFDTKPFAIYVRPGWA